MSSDETDKAQAAIDRVLELAAEVEASGESVTHEDTVAAARAILHQWVDTVTAVAITAAFGRVTLIHDNGRQSSIQSPELPYLMSKPVGARTE